MKISNADTNLCMKYENICYQDISMEWDNGHVELSKENQRDLWIWLRELFKFN